MWERVPFLPSAWLGALRGRAQVRQALMRSACDVVFFNTQVPAALGGTPVRRRLYVISTDITPIQYDGMALHYNHHPDRPGPLKWYKHRANVRLLRSAARLLPWSTWTGHSLAVDYGVCAEHIHVTPPGVDLECWAAKADYSRAACMRVLFVGGDFYRKGGETLLRAFKALPSGTVELHVVTRSQIPAVEGVRLYQNMSPNSEALIALYQSCDCFVLPTEAEAFGIAAVEAGATGLPVVATLVGGLADIVADGESGFLIQPGDAAALAQRLRLLADDAGLRERMGRAARARAMQRFDARVIADQIVRILFDVAAGQEQAVSTNAVTGRQVL
ncbi:MAG: glycosyltransferase family 4 protein [Chloroflexi bacterium]|nr:glycosyltransferase family 4 protein [Chloroflexota bacterium]